VEEMLNRELSNYTKKKDQQQLKTTANMTSGGTNTINRLVLFEPTLSKREKEITERKNLLHQCEKDFTKEMEQVKLEIQKTVTKGLKWKTKFESQRLQDEHDKFVDGIRSLKKNLDDQYNNKMQRIISRETGMNKSLEEKDKKIAQLSFSIALTKEDNQGIKKTLTSVKSLLIC
jgi:benzoyl-CoA reductase/2-hydroxyglutaryl-CoA dehydratase subunit BcrC/BadD/HgdB